MKNEIESRRVRFRSLLPSDYSIFVALYGDIESMVFVGAVLSEAQLAKSFSVAVEQSASCLEGLGFQVVVDEMTRDILGICAANASVPRLDRIEVGLMLLTEVRGKRWAQIVMAEFICSIFRRYEIDKVWLQYDRNHQAVARYTKKLGFEVTEERMVRGRWCLVAQLSRVEWLKTVISTSRE